MSMSDCEKCWDTPCECGWEYRSWSKTSRLNLASVVLGISIDELTSRVSDIIPDVHPLAKDKDSTYGAIHGDV